MATGKDLVQHWEQMKNDRAMWDSQWQDIANYMVPHKAGIIAPLTPGQKTTDKIYDSTAIFSSRDLAAWIHSNLTSAAMEWYSLKVAGIDNPSPEEQKWLDSGTATEFDHLSVSNFYQEIHECWLDLATFCTSALFIDERKDEKGQFAGLLYRALFPGEYAFDEGEDGRVVTLFRTFQLAAQEAVNKWPGTISDEVVKKAEKNPSEKITFLHAVFPKTWFGGYQKSQFPFISVYVDLTNKTILNKGGYYEFPFAVARWEKWSGEQYGRGPGFTALPDVKTLNAAVKLTLKAWAKAIDPPVEALENRWIGPMRLNAGGVNIVSQLGAIKPIDFGGKWDVTNINIEKLRQQVSRNFHSDQIQLLPPPSETTGKMTAYEVSVRYELMQRLLGPAFAHITSEFLTPIVERSFSILFRNRIIGPPPQSLVGRFKKGGRVNVQYEGPLARAQRSQEIESINKTMLFLQPITQVKPDIYDVFKLDDAARRVARLNGVDEALINDDEAVTKLRGDRASAQKSQVEAENVATMARAAKDATPFLTQVKPGQMDALAQMAGGGMQDVLPEGAAE